MVPSSRTDADHSLAPRALAWGAVAFVLAMVVRQSWVTEDAYITLRTCDNWLAGYGLRWNIAERVQAYTHPLWMLVLTAALAVVRDAFAAALVSRWAVTLLALGLLLRLSHSAGHAVLAVVLLGTSRAFVDYSTSGLENPLTHVCLAWLVLEYTKKEPSLRRLSLVAALLALCRADALIFALAPLAMLSWQRWRQQGLRALATDLCAGFWPLVAWELFSLWYYGSLVPNTAYAKLNTGIPALELRLQGLAYLTNAMAWDPTLLVGLFVGAAAGWLGGSRTRVLWIGVALYLVYTVRVGGDFMQARFLTGPLFLSACLIARLPVGLERNVELAVWLLPAAVLLGRPWLQEVDRADVGAADERETYRDGMSLRHFARGLRLPRHTFRDGGEEMARHASQMPVRPAYNVGVTGFFAGPRVFLIDQNALTDPLLARLPMREDPSWRIGHFARRLPVGYVQTVQSGTCQMLDKALCTYYGHLREVVSGDLWSLSRLQTIVRFQLGQYEHLIDKKRYRSSNLRKVGLDAFQPQVVAGAAWTAPGAMEVPLDGLEIGLGGLAHNPAIHLLLDGGDRYNVAFLRGDEEVGKAEVATEKRAFLGPVVVPVPVAASGKGYDAVVLRPVSGDGAYAAANVTLPAAPAAP